MKTAAAWNKVGQREEDFPFDPGMYRADASAWREAPHLVSVARPAAALAPDNDTHRKPPAAPLPFQFRRPESAADEAAAPAEHGTNYDWYATSGSGQHAVPAWLAAGQSAAPAGRLMLKPKRASAWRWGLPLLALVVIAGGGAGLYVYGGAAFPTDRAGAPDAHVAAPAATDGEAVPAPKKVKTAAVHEAAATTSAAQPSAAATPPATTTTPKEAAVVMKPAATAVQPLPPNDARWARAEGAAPQPAPAQKADQVATAAKPDAPSAPSAEAAADNAPAAASGKPPAVAPSAFVRPAKPPAAERQAAPQARSDTPEANTGESDLPGVDVGTLPAAEKPAAKAAPFVATRHAAVSTAVKMHAGPGNGSHVIGVIPSGGSVAVANCSDWCRVSYKGREGWIYREFVHGSGSSHKSAAAAPKPTTSAVTTAAIKPAAASDNKPVPIAAPHKRGR